MRVGIVGRFPGLRRRSVVHWGERFDMGDGDSETHKVTIICQ